MRTGLAAAFGTCVALLSAPEAIAQQYTGTYTVAGQGGTVTLTLRYADFETFSRQRKVMHALNHGLDIHAVVSMIFSETHRALAAILR